METMDKNLEKIRDTRANRIDMMQSALDDFTKNAKELPWIFPLILQTISRNRFPCCYRSI